MGREVVRQVLRYLCRGGGRSSPILICQTTGDRLAQDDPGVEAHRWAVAVPLLLVGQKGAKHLGVGDADPQSQQQLVIGHTAGLAAASTVDGAFSTRRRT